VNDWLVDNYEELILICKKITRNSDVDDLLHLCIEQFMKNKNIETIAQTQWLFFFARIVRNNYFSNSSPYSRTYSKYKFSEMHDLEVIDLQYEEPVIDLLWVKDIISRDKMTDQWYYARLFELYLEVGCSIKKLSILTTIPANSVSRDINKYRNKLRKERNKILSNGL
jgi:hypothetical protein